MRIVVLNGAPRSGKDTSGQLILDYVVDGRSHGYRLKFSDPLKSSVHAMFGYSLEPDALESVKDLPNERMFGKTPREMYIQFSEKNMKAMFGPNVFADLMIQRLIDLRRHKAHALVIIADCGFQPEADRVAAWVEPHNFCLVELHRPGCTFAKDSRSLLRTPKGAKKLVIDNDKDIAHLRRTLCRELTSWVNGHS